MDKGIRMNGTEGWQKSSPDDWIASSVTLKSLPAPQWVIFSVFLWDAYATNTLQHQIQIDEAAQGYWSFASLCLWSLSVSLFRLLCVTGTTGRYLLYCFHSKQNKVLFIYTFQTKQEGLLVTCEGLVCSEACWPSDALELLTVCFLQARWIYCVRHKKEAEMNESSSSL